MVNRFKLVFCFILTMVAVVFTFAQSSNFHTVIYTFSFENASIYEVVNYFEKDKTLHFFFDEADSALTNLKLSADFKDEELTVVLNDLLRNTAFTCHFIGSNNVIIMPKSGGGSQLSDIQSTQKAIRIGNVSDRGKYRNALLTGTVSDGKTGMPIIGAVVYAMEKDKGAVTDIKGHYKMEVPVGKQTFQFSYVGFENQELEMEIISSGTLNVELFEETIELNEVVVSRKRPDKNITQAQIGTIEIKATEITTIPTLMGEADLMKTMTLMPGVQTIGEAASGFNIRGGSVDQNLVIIEDVPVFNTAHLFGFFSTIHSGVVSDVTLYKGNVPANYGGRIASIMDIGVKDGNAEQATIDGGIGLINARLTLEIPVVKDKFSFIAGGRTTYSDWILKQMPDANLQGSSAGYYDLITKLKWNLNRKNTISAFAYTSHDNFNLAGSSAYSYGNTLANLKYYHVFSSRMSVQALTSYSNYSLQVESHDFEGDPFSRKLASDIKLYTAKMNFTWVPVARNLVDFGVEGNRYKIFPGKQNPFDSSSIIEHELLDPEQAREIAFYFSDNIDITNRFSIIAGLRYSMFDYLGPKTVYAYDTDAPMSAETIFDSSSYSANEKIASYHYREPRLVFRFSIDEKSSIKLGYNYSVQYIQLLSNTAAAAPADIWKLCDSYVKPLKSQQYSLGYFRNFKDNTIEFSAELYYKQMKNLIDYKNGAELLMNKYIETQIVNGEGQAYGIELLLRKKSGLLSGWVGYTYSRSSKMSLGVFSEDLVNRGEHYPAAYEKPNNITATVNYKLSRRFSFSANFTYSTGRPVTLPEYQFEIDGRKMVYFSDRNKYRLPDYHRLDVAINYHGHIKSAQRWKSSWTLSVFNVYGRNNPYSVYYTKDQPTAANGYRDYVLYKLSIVDRPIPTLTYNFKF